MSFIKYVITLTILGMFAMAVAEAGWIKPPRMLTTAVGIFSVLTMTVCSFLQWKLQKRPFLEAFKELAACLAAGAAVIWLIGVAVALGLW